MESAAVIFSYSYALVIVGIRSKAVHVLEGRKLSAVPGEQACQIIDRIPSGVAYLVIGYSRALPRGESVAPRGVVVAQGLGLGSCAKCACSESLSLNCF